MRRAGVGGAGHFSCLQRKLGTISQWVEGGYNRVNGDSSRVGVE